MNGGAPVLIVDLDGTLCRTDTLHEAILHVARSAPLQLLNFPGWLARGKINFKTRLANFGVLSAENLPLNSEVIESLKAARAEGRRIALVSASEQRQVKAVAEATGLFDEVFGTNAEHNLKGGTKADFLTERFGYKGFDYMGNAWADIPVWAAANKAITVCAGTPLRKAAETANTNTVHMAEPGGTTWAMIRALRPYQWSKNLLVFLPLLAAHEMGALLQVLLGFFVFSFAASSVYIFNDLLDLPSDRAHPRKCDRPFASGVIGVQRGMAMALILIVLTITVGLMVGSAAFLMVLAGYVFLTFAYSLWLKKRLIIDVVTLGGLYTLRVLAGGAAGGITLSPWILGFSGFLFLALAAVKRQAELIDQLENGRKNSGRGYEVQDLPILRGIAISSGHAAVVIFAIYIASDDVQRLYAFSDLLWLVCPLLLYWILRMVIKSDRGFMTDDPIVFASTDRISLLVIVLSLTLVYVAAFWPWAVVMF